MVPWFCDWLCHIFSRACFGKRYIYIAGHRLVTSACCWRWLILGNFLWKFANGVEFIAMVPWWYVSWERGQTVTYHTPFDNVKPTISKHRCCLIRAHILLRWHQCSKTDMGLTFILGSNFLAKHLVSNLIIRTPCLPMITPVLDNKSFILVWCPEIVLEWRFDAT